MNSFRKLYMPVGKVAVAKNSTIDKLKATINKCASQADVPLQTIKDTDLHREIEELINHMSILNSTNPVEYNNLYSYIKEVFADTPIKMNTVGGRIAGCTKGSLNTCNPQCAGSIKPHYNEGGAPCVEHVLTMHGKKDVRIIHRGGQTSRSCKLYLIDIPRETLNKETVRIIRDNVGIDTMTVIAYSTQGESHSESTLYESEDIEAIIADCCGEDGCEKKKHKESGISWWWAILLLIIILVVILLFCCFCRK